ncbi:MAG TPA: glycosyltransferase family 2 protein [Polyangiales bacterium]|nr:glycosyltransferase family 2 protein [Polyangiales bacterium]
MPPPDAEPNTAVARSWPRISVAIPIYNEASGIHELVARLTAVLDQLPAGPHEIVFADDGSSDGSLELLHAAAQRDARIVVVSLSRNFGHQAALSAALDHTSGEVVVLMDGDLQDTPETIPRFVEEYRKGSDVVYALRVRRKESFWLRASYALAYRIIGSLSRVDIPRGAGDFSLMSRRVVDLVRKSKERQRYLRGLRSWVGFQQTGIEVERAARHAGESKYSLASLLRLMFDGVFAFSTVPLRVATTFGLIAVALASLFGLYSVYAKFMLDQSPQGFTALIVAIVFLAGVQLIFLGVIGEYIGRIYEEVKERPHYIVNHVQKSVPAATSVANDQAAPTSVRGALTSR